MTIGTCNCGLKASFANPIRGTAAGKSCVWPQCRYSHSAAGVPVSAITYAIAEKMGGDIDAAILQLMAKKEAAEDKKRDYAADSRSRLDRAKQAGRTGLIRDMYAWRKVGGNVAKLSDDEAIDLAKNV